MGAHVVSDDSPISSDCFSVVSAVSNRMEQVHGLGRIQFKQPITAGVLTSAFRAFTTYITYVQHTARFCRHNLHLFDRGHHGSSLVLAGKKLGPEKGTAFFSL